MRRPPVLLRVLLLLAFCANGVAATWAGTRMAMHQLQVAVAHMDRTGDSAGAVGRLDDCNEDVVGASDQLGTSGKHDDHGGCDCSGQASCSCNCVLPVFASETAPAFAAPHQLNSLQPILQSPPTTRDQIPRLFRPPIG